MLNSFRKFGIFAVVSLRALFAKQSFKKIVRQRRDLAPLFAGRTSAERRPRKDTGRYPIVKVLKLLRTSYVFLFVMLLLIPSSFAFEGRQSKEILDNGLTVLVSEMPGSTMVSVYALVKAGSATEGKFLGTGVSHFLEHMVFKGTTTRVVGEISASIQAVGGTINASTGKDYTIFTINVPAEHFDMALDIMADMMQNSSFDLKEFEKERQVILDEMRMHHDNPYEYLSELLFQQVYKVHPYRHPVIGYESLFKDLTRDEMVSYYKSFYTPSNMILSIAGKVKNSEISGKIKDAFKDFKRKNEIIRNLVSEPEQIIPQSYEEEYPSDVSRMSILFPGVKLRDSDVYALDVLAIALGQGESSILHKELYQKLNLVHDVTTDNYTPFDRGIFEVSVVFDYEKKNQVKNAILDQFHLIKKKGLSGKELSKAKRLVLSDHIMDQQTTSRVAYSQALDEAFVGDFQFSEKYVAMIRDVSNEDILRAANRYFDENKMSTVVLKTKGTASIDATSSNVVKDPQIKKYVLDNHLTILLREDHTFPVVSMRLVLNGGTNQEVDENNGVFQMLSQLWEKGTKHLNSSQIAERVESLGMSFGMYSGKNSFGVSVDAMSENVMDGINLIEDFVKNPTFPDAELPKIKEEAKIGLKMRDDSVNRLASFHLRKLLYLKHPFRLDDAGTIESIDKVSQKDIVSLYHQFSVPNNMVLSVFGDIDPEKILRSLKEKFSTLKNQDYQLKKLSEKPVESIRQEDMVTDKAQAVLMMGFHGPELKSDEMYAVKVMTAILGSPFSGRLFTKVREEFGQAYTLGGYYLPGFGTGMICFYVQTTNEHLRDVQKLIEDEIKDLQANEVSDDELLGVKNYLKGTFQADLETNSSLSYTASLDELYGLGFENYQNFNDNIDKVSKKDIKSLAVKYLDITKKAIVLMRSSTKIIL